MLGLSTTFGIFLSWFHVMGILWWIWLPVILAFAAYWIWFFSRRLAYIAGMKWVLLEVILPPDVPKSSPRLADSLFAGLHFGYAKGTSWKPQFFQGKVPDWFSFEVVSNGGETHFYIRCPEAQRNIVESLVFSQYPDAEIYPANDYVDFLPAQFDPANYDIASSEFEFVKEPAYPIKVYEEFEDAGGKDEHARIDPMSPLLEMMSVLHPGEHLWVQYLLRPTGGGWIKDAQAVVDKMKGKEEEKPKPPGAGIIKVIDALLGIEKPEEKKEERKQFNLQALSPTEKLVLEKVQNKLSKLAFKVGIRVFYAARKEAFNGTRTAGVTAMFKQLYNNSMNSFKVAASSKSDGFFKWIFPSDKGLFSDELTLRRKKLFYQTYRQRKFPLKFVILNTEELATLWHLPGLNVQAPLLPRVQAKKGQPPVVLPTR